MKRMLSLFGMILSAATFVIAAKPDCDLTSVKQVKDRAKDLSNCIVRNIDFTDLNPEMKIEWRNINLTNTVFLGCKLDEEDSRVVYEKGAIVLPALASFHLPYDPFRTTLYDQKTLSGACCGQSADELTYKHFVEHGGFYPDPTEALFQSIHDYSMDRALTNFIGQRSISAPALNGCVNPATTYKIVGIMGWHDGSRSSEEYRMVAKVAWQLSRPPGNYTIITGGGPGMMEAGNLGAYLANYKDPSVVDQAVDILKRADMPKPDNDAYVHAAEEVLKKFDKGSVSIAIPSWFYGEERTNLFATHIAKFFSNSIREDELVSRPDYGIVFALGSAGTAQEIFQDAVQNYYGSFGEFSPMAFLSDQNQKYVKVLRDCVNDIPAYVNYGYVSDVLTKPDDVMNFILNHCPHAQDSKHYDCKQ